MPGIFISYRRDDAAGWAGRLSADLRAGLRGAAVFMDIDAIPPGVPYDDYIAQAVGSCDVLIALIGPHWLTVTDKAGRRRLDDPADLTRLEILAALQRNIRVIPALVGGAEMPAADELPDALKPLGRRQAYELADHRWNGDCARLVQVLKPIVGGGTPAGKRVLAGASLVLVLLASGYGVKLWLDRQPGPQPTPTTVPSTVPTTVPTTATTTVPTTVPTTVTTTVPTTVTTTVPTPKPLEPRIALSQSELDFGSAAVGGKPVPKRFFIRNLTGQPLIVEYEVRGSHAKEFPPTVSNCDPPLKGRMTLTENCYVGLEFVPADTGPRGAVALVRVLDSLNEVQRVTLSGTGLASKSGADLKAEGRCVRLSETTYEVELWGSASGPADATLSLDFQTRPSTGTSKVAKQWHSCGDWKSLSEGRTICMRAHGPATAIHWRYKGALLTKDVPAVAAVFLTSKRSPVRKPHSGSG